MRSVNFAAMPKMLVRWDGARGGGFALAFALAFALVFALAFA